MRLSSAICGFSSCSAVKAVCIGGRIPHSPIPPPRGTRGEGGACNAPGGVPPRDRFLQPTCGCTPPVTLRVPPSPPFGRRREERSPALVHPPGIENSGGVEGGLDALGEL